MCTAAKGEATQLRGIMRPPPVSSASRVDDIWQASSAGLDTLVLNSNIVPDHLHERAAKKASIDNVRLTSVFAEFVDRLRPMLPGHKEAL